MAAERSGYLGVSWILLLVFLALSALCLVALVAVRTGRDARERREVRRTEAVRALIFDLLMGEDDEVDAARGQLASARGRAWDRVEAQVFVMLPKIKGESRSVLVELLLDRGAEAHAVALTTSRSAVRRCRGAFQLGVLGRTTHLERLQSLLGDRTFLVRRVAVRALGALGDPRAVRPLLLVGEHDPRLTRDLVSALDRIGAAGAAELREVLGAQMRGGDQLHLEPAAVVLGLIGDPAALEVLATGLVSADPALAGACAEALGRIGSPEGIAPLVAALDDLRPNVRGAAARALGAIGSQEAVASLVEVVDEEEPQVSRQAAQGLVELGAEARSRLATSTSAYAVEALALHQIKAAR